MNQSRPTLLPSYGALVRRRILDDYGSPGGASNGLYVRAENGQEYIAKGPSLAPQMPYIAANELIAVRFAAVLGLPVLDHCLLERQGELFFGSAYLRSRTWYPQITDDLFQKCENRDRVYDVVAFDTWICNTDRHGGNLLVRHDQTRQPVGTDRHLLLLNDHSHALCSPGVTPVNIASLLDVPPGRFVLLPFVAEAIHDAADLGAAIARIEALDDGLIADVLRSVPDAFASPADRAMIGDFLVRRRDRLRQVFQGGTSSFPYLRGAP